MKKLFSGLAGLTLCFGSFSFAFAETAALKVTSNSIVSGGTIPEKYAFCAPDGKGKTKDGGNISPEISWSGAPAGTKSYALIVVDPDVPAKFDDANKEGKTIAPDFPRQNFYHWVLVDIPASVNSIPEAADSKGHVEGGKPLGKTSYGVNGRNDYASFMKGTFGGYDGSCPPWNDARLHHYYFIVYALDVETLGLPAEFGGKEAMAMIDKHTLAKGAIYGTYTNFVPVKK